MRFRTKKIGIVADIEKTFLQIGLQPTERDATRFLWLKDINLSVTPTNIITYRFTRVPFDMISSLFLLEATTNYHLGNWNGTDECNIHRNIYVDNFITGVNSKEEASRMYETSKSKFKEIWMNLYEWKSSSNDVNELFQDDKMKGSKLNVLDLHRNTVSNNMAIPTEKFDKLMIATTKWQILASITSLFDPQRWKCVCFCRNYGIKKRIGMIQLIKRILENGEKLWKR